MTHSLLKLSRHLAHVSAGALLLFATAPAQAVDGMAIVYGDGDGSDNVDMFRIAAQWDWDQRWFDNGGCYLSGYWELDAGYWDGQGGLNDSLADIGFTPVFRFQSNASSGIQPYVEGGIGAHLLSESQINSKDMSTSFQFGDHIGAGLRFGNKLEWDLGYRYQHFSNAGIKKPNPGINFHQIRLGYHFD